MLFVGNSYCWGLPTHFSSIARLAIPSVRVDAITPGGGLLSWQVVGEADRLLRGAEAGGLRWDVVVLQEQSQTPSFPRSDSQFADSANAFVHLDRRARAADMQTVLFATWGHRGGDPWNPSFNPDFGVMSGECCRVANGDTPWARPCGPDPGPRPKLS